uniref:Palmitoyltransferase n=1 Tax=Setaria digitata TaxID=48799 RepID=A0A915PSP6_9BILA
MKSQRRRRNGWSWPPSFLQMVCWVAIPVAASSTAFLLMPLHVLYAPLVVFIGTIWLVLQIITLTCIDPAVTNIQRSQAPAYFDPSKHEHVIENLFCNICLVNVDPTCKHCRQCNKCISGFDHHCKWLNNCVGEVNYRLFLLLVLSVCLISALVSICLVSLTVMSFINIELLPDAKKLPMELTLWRGLCFALGILYSTLAVLCAHLLYFHYKLWQRGMTTYNFIRVNRKCTNNQQKKNLSVDINTISGIVPVEKSSSKLSIIKSRTVRDSTTDSPYVSFTS